MKSTKRREKNDMKRTKTHEINTESKQRSVPRQAILQASDQKSNPESRPGRAGIGQGQVVGMHGIWKVGIFFCIVLLTQLP